MLAKPGVSELECLLKDKTEKFASDTLCKKKVHVGWEPLPVESLRCTSNQLESLECVWEAPWNPVPTDYSATLRPTRPGPPSPEERRCPPPTSKCHVNATTSPRFVQDAVDGLYTLTITGWNPLAPLGVAWTHVIDLSSAKQQLTGGGGGDTTRLELPLDTSTRRGRYAAVDEAARVEEGVVSWGACWRLCNLLTSCHYWEYSLTSQTCRRLSTRSAFTSDYTFTAGQKIQHSVDCYPLQ